MASASQSPPEEPHVADDDNLLARWSQGLLDAAEHQQIIVHLSNCPDCREDVAAMIRVGALELPEVTEPAAGAVEEHDDVEAAEPTGNPIRGMQALAPPLRKSWTRGLARWVALVAAGILVMAAVWMIPRQHPAGDLASAERALNEGQAQEALERAEKLLGGELAAPLRERATRVLEQAGYVLARDRLQAREFAQVLDVEHRVSRQSKPSARLRNVRLQAERGIPAEIALAQADVLTAYGYELNGASLGKAFPVLDGTAERWDRDLRAAAAAFPEDVQLHLNLGQFLLTQHRFDDAREQFVAAADRDPRSVFAQIGLGLSAFEQRADEAALQHFQSALEIEPQNVAAHVNAAVCLERLGRGADAAAHWRRALELTTDVTLRRRIEEHRKPRS